MLRSSLCDYNDPCILEIVTILINGGPADATDAKKLDE